MRKMTALAALFVSAAVIAGACGGTPSVEGSYEPGTGAAGGTLLVGDYQDITDLNYGGTVMDANVNATLFDGLVKTNNEPKYIPWLAEELPSVKNGGIVLPGTDGDAMTVTWKLRAGRMWSDGAPITCDDVSYWYDWMKLPGNFTDPVSTGANAVSKVDCPDANTIVLHYSEIYSGVYGGPGILPKQYYSQFCIGCNDPAKDMLLGAGFRDADLPNVPTSGPFKIASRTPGVETVMVRNDKWTNPYTGKPANLESIKYVVCGQTETCLAKFRAGELDIVTDLSGADYASTKDLGKEQFVQKTFSYEFLRMNMSADDCSIDPAVVAARVGKGCPVADLTIRKAIAQATDKQGIWERVLGEAGVVAESSVPDIAWYYKAGTPTKFDLAAAKKTLTDGGWVDSNGDGVVEKGGVAAVLELCTTMKTVRKAQTAFIASDLAKIGIRLVYRPGGTVFATWGDTDESTSCNLARGNFDIAMHAFSTGIDPTALYSTYNSKTVEPNGTNDAKVNLPEMDKALEALKSTIDLSEQAKQAGVVQDLLNSQYIELPLYYWMGLEVVSSKVGGFLQNPTSAGPLWNAGDLSLAN
ncbi:MAG: ABC transporter substrate-binding protein [Chloroflexota bacterium]